MPWQAPVRSEEHTSELQSQFQLVCRLLLEKKKRTRHLLGCVIEAYEFKCPISRDLGKWIRFISRYRLYPTSVNSSTAFFFLNDTATTEIYTLSLPDALPIYAADGDRGRRAVHTPVERGRARQVC